MKEELSLFSKKTDSALSNNRLKIDQHENTLGTQRQDLDSQKAKLHSTQEKVKDAEYRLEIA